MDPAKIGEVKTVQYHMPNSTRDGEVSAMLRDGWVILATKITETERLYRNVWPNTVVFILGKPREKPNLGKRLDVDEDAIGAGAPIDTLTRDLRKFNLASSQCEGRNEPPGQ